MRLSLPETSRSKGLVMAERLDIQKALASDWRGWANDEPEENLLVCPECGEQSTKFGSPPKVEDLIPEELQIAIELQSSAYWNCEPFKKVLIISMKASCGSEWEIRFEERTWGTDEDPIDWTSTHIQLVTSCKPEGYVYFIEAERLERIKIGYSKDPEQRRKTLSTGSPSVLRIIKKIAGDQKLENEIQTRFGHLLIEELDGDEWFRATEELREFIEKLAPAP